MKITSDNLFTPKTTGYAAAAGLCMSVISGKTKNRTLRRMHKPLAYATVAFTLLHIGLIEYNYFKWKNKTGQ